MKRAPQDSDGGDDDRTKTPTHRPTLRQQHRTPTTPDAALSSARLISTGAKEAVDTPMMQTSVPGAPLRKRSASRQHTAQTILFRRLSFHSPNNIAMTATISSR
ncbi:hypothetical protein HD806DRAFT_349458 [Xylariaceae sp. AK1471]|nr:hypothetical protein HD806DRAFT_349458 [Xylariaceae sp. AK1471]